MRPLSASSIVQAWGRGRPLPLPRRPLALLAEALPDAPAHQLATLTVGERDELLLNLRRSTFGRTLRCHTGCPQCSATLTFDLEIDELLAEGGDRPGIREDLVEQDGYRVRFRLPSSADLAAAASLGDLELGRAALLESCVIEARHRSAVVGAAQLPETVVAAIGARMARLDPRAEVPIDLQCPDCDHPWSPLLDIASFLWQEVAAMAERLMYDVHVLARYYGWTEEAILAMGSARRKRYLDMANPGA